MAKGRGLDGSGLDYIELPVEEEEVKEEGLECGGGRKRMMSPGVVAPCLKVPNHE